MRATRRRDLPPERTKVRVGGEERGRRQEEFGTRALKPKWRRARILDKVKVIINYHP